MLKQIKKWFSKGNEDKLTHLPIHERAIFNVTADGILVGVLESRNGLWTFKYGEDFKIQRDKYNLIIGFPDINKEYHSDTLWPFFRIRIPGLKQPAVQQILKIEHIDQKNEVALLKRFGKKTISNPYEMEFSDL